MTLETAHKLSLHPSSISRLETAVSKLNQTVLLSGRQYVGKLEAAKWLAEQVVGGRWRTQSVIIDVNDKGNISIEDIQKIRGLSYYKSSDSTDRRVVIVNNAHTMSIEAQNSFLKMLEEPPADLYMIMATWQPEKLLATIRSRVVTIDIQAPTFAQTHELFPEVEVELLNRLYLMTNGSTMLIGEMIQDREHAYSQNIKRAKTLIGQSVYERLAELDAMSKDKPGTEALLEGVTTILLSALESSATQGKSVKTLLPKIDSVMQARASLRQNHNTKLTLTLLFCSL